MGINNAGSNSIYGGINTPDANSICCGIDVFGSGLPPSGSSYVAENGTDFYVAENGTDFYVTEG